VPRFFCKSAHGISERQRCAIVRKTKTTRDGPTIIAELPVWNFHKIACAFAGRKRTNSAPAGGASSIRKRRNHAIRPEQRRPGCPNTPRLGLNSNDAAV
jgi:hypothetical protein